MCDHDSRHMHLFQTLADLSLRYVVQRAGRLIEQKDIRIARNRTGNQDSLLLSSGNCTGRFIDHGIHAHRHAGNIFLHPRLLSRSLSRFAAGRPRRDDDILINTAGNQAAILQDDAQTFAQRMLVDRQNILAVIKHTAGFRRFKTQKQLQDCRLSAARAPDNTDIFSRFHVERDILQNVAALIRIRKCDMIQRHPACELIEVPAHKI